MIQGIHNHIDVDFPANKKIIVTAFMIHRFPKDVGIQSESLLAAAKRCTEELSLETYQRFEAEHRAWKEEDLGAMVRDMKEADSMMESMLVGTPQEKEWYPEWKRGTEFHRTLLRMAREMLEKL